MGKARSLWDSPLGHSPDQTRRKVHSQRDPSTCPAFPSAGDVQENDAKAWPCAMLDHFNVGPEGLGDPLRALGGELLGLWEPISLHGRALLPSSLLA